MREWLVFISEHAILAIDAMALVVILFGTVEAFVRASCLAFAQESGPQRRDIWLRFARWLVAGLTFQLAADIIETSITTNWDALGRVAVIATDPHGSQSFPRQGRHGNRRAATPGRKRIGDGMWRRCFLKCLFAVALAHSAFGPAFAQTDPLPSWNDGSGQSVDHRLRRTRDHAGRPGFRPAGRAHRHLFDPEFPDLEMTYHKCGRDPM